MFQSVFRVVILFFLLIFFLPVFPQKSGLDQPSFDVASANQKLQSIQKKLENRSDYASFTYYVKELESLQDGAKVCVSYSNDHLKIINTLLQSTQAEHVAQFERADTQYLENKQLYYAKQSSECRLFVYRSEEALTDYRDTMQQLSASQILKRSTSIWEMPLTDGAQVISQVNFNKILEESGLKTLVLNQWIAGFILFIFTMSIMVYVHFSLKAWLSQVKIERVLLRSLLVVFIRCLIPFSIFGYASLFFTLAFDTILPVPTTVLISHALFLFVIAIAVSRYLFYPCAQLSGLFSLPSELGRSFHRRFLLLLSGLFLGYVISILSHDQIIPHSVTDCIRTVFITIIAFIAMWIFLLWRKSPFVSRFRRTTVLFLSTVIILALCGLVIAEWFGYHRLAIFAIIGLLMTALDTLVLVAVWRSINLLYFWIDDKQFTLSRKIHHFLGVKYSKKLREIALIKFVLHAAILCFYCVVVLASWSISSNLLSALVTSLLYGFKFLGLSIFPLRIALALIAFSVILLAGRLIATRIARKQPYFKGEEDTQIAIGTITLYISFSVAFLFGLLITGVDFTGLAIIAGALSVGVGLGLQNIVNNFVSGLILLIEKPIRPGDRIVIGKTEGFVRKIRIRSTQIATLSKEDVIVPNADLITQQVTNFMYRDRNSRISCEVGVAYGTDVALVKQLLLQVAANHKEVVHEAPNDPVVLFRKFGESSLHFELWCVIHDVNNKSVVASDLNFAIDAVFREHRIVIPFPQRDLHIIHETKEGVPQSQ